MNDEGTSTRWGFHCLAKSQSKAMSLDPAGNCHLEGFRGSVFRVRAKSRERGTGFQEGRNRIHRRCVTNREGKGLKGKRSRNVFGGGVLSQEETKQKVARRGIHILRRKRVLMQVVPLGEEDT